MAALYWRGPTAEAMVKAKLKPSDVPVPVVQVWPENVSAFDLFLRNQTQWRMGACGPVGLDYGMFYHDLDRRDLPADQYDEMLRKVRIIEQAALNVFYKK